MWQESPTIISYMGVDGRRCSADKTSVHVFDELHQIFTAASFQIHATRAYCGGEPNSDGLPSRRFIDLREPRLLAMAAIEGASMKISQWIFLALPIVFVGCARDMNKSALNQKRYPVSGKVTLADGKPLTEGTISFLPDNKTGEQVGLSAVGKIQADGSFELDGGAPAGNYRVKLSRPSIELTSPAATKTAKPPKPPFSDAYLDEDASGLVAEVQATDSNVLPPFVLVNKKTALPAPAGKP